VSLRTYPRFKGFQGEPGFVVARRSLTCNAGTDVERSTAPSTIHQRHVRKGRRTGIRRNQPRKYILWKQCGSPRLVYCTRWYNQGISQDNTNVVKKALHMSGPTILHRSLSQTIRPRLTCLREISHKSSRQLSRAPTQFGGRRPLLKKCQDWRQDSHVTTFFHCM